MVMDSADKMSGYTIVELMITIVIVAFLAATLSMFFARLLTIQEDEREEGYVRETLSDICGLYADNLSVGSSLATNLNGFAVMYRGETGGVSLETGRVSHVTSLTSFVNKVSHALNMNIATLEQGIKYHNLRGDAVLIPLTNSLVGCTLTPLTVPGEGETALGYLKLVATFEADKAEHLMKTVTVGRVLRLWNRE